jgi:hypothetical protein
MTTIFGLYALLAVSFGTAVALELYRGVRRENKK